MPVEKFLRDHFGDQLVLTSMKHVLRDKVKGTRLVQWICEHAKDGLRVAESVYYTHDDGTNYPFPKGSTLVLTSCESGIDFELEQSLASSICASSHCTVIAPCSLVATEAGVRFARKLDRKVRDSNEQLRVVDLWRTLCVTNDDVEADRTKLTPEACFIRWYGIYGNGEARVN
jgi:hypothetical protein